MKALQLNFRLCLTFLMVTMVTVQMYGQWSISPSGTAQDLNGVHVISPVKAFITGNAGTLRVTTDGGTSWSQVVVPTAQDINGIYFVDEFTGYAAVDNGGVLKTADGGALWSLQAVGTANNLRDVHFTDANTGTAVGENGAVFRTTNGGTSWTMQTSGTTERLESVFFTSSMTGFAVGRNGVNIVTSNGGTTWSSGTVGANADLDDVFFVDANTGFIARQNNFIHKTTDGGASWSLISTNAIGNGFDAMHFADLSTGYGVNNNGFLAKSVDGGLTWAVQASGTAQNLNDVHCFDANNCIVVGDAGTVLTMLAPQGCITPTGLSTTNLTGISATLNWTVVDAATSYQIQGRAIGSTALVSITIPSGATNSFNVAGLQPGTGYEWQIRSICGPNDMSDFSSFTMFTTLDCATPAPVSTSNITSTTATLNWTTVPEAQGYTIYGRVVGSSQIVSLSIAGGATSSFNVIGLTPGTSYEWTAVSVCNIPGAIVSDLANIEVFTTLPSPAAKRSIDAEGIQSVSVFPNPASERFVVSWSGNSVEATIFISDMNGRVVLRKTSDAEQEAIDISNLAPGLYQVIVNSGTYSMTEKLLITK